MLGLFYQFLAFHVINLPSHSHANNPVWQYSTSVKFIINVKHCRKNHIIWPTSITIKFDTFTADWCLIDNKPSLFLIRNVGMHLSYIRGASVIPKYFNAVNIDIHHASGKFSFVMSWACDGLPIKSQHKHVGRLLIGVSFFICHQNMELYNGPTCCPLMLPPFTNYPLCVKTSLQTSCYMSLGSKPAKILCCRRAHRRQTCNNCFHISFWIVYLQANSTHTIISPFTNMV